MKGSVKFFIAGLVLFAASIGFFAGSFCNKPCQKNGPMPCMKNGEFPPPPPMNGPGPNFEHKGPGKHMGPKPHEMKGPNPAALDSILQVTPEQKAALEKNRLESDSIFKDLRHKKFEADRMLGEALDSEDAAKIEEAKNKVTEAHNALLDHRIKAVAHLNKILSKEQREKFRAFHKEHKKDFKGPKFKGAKFDGFSPEGKKPEPQAFDDK